MTERTRSSLYAVAAGALAVLVILGVISGPEHDTLLTAVGAVLALVTAALMVVAARHVTPDSWSTLRHAAYAAASAVFAALGMLGLVDPTVITTTLAILTEVLNVAGVLLLGTAAVKVPTGEDR